MTARTEHRCDVPAPEGQDRKKQADDGFCEHGLSGKCGVPRQPERNRCDLTVAFPEDDDGTDSTGGIIESQDL